MPRTSRFRSPLRWWEYDDRAAWDAQIAGFRYFIHRHDNEEPFWLSYLEPCCDRPERQAYFISTHGSLNAAKAAATRHLREQVAKYADVRRHARAIVRIAEEQKLTDRR